jgi:NAD(P)-dependent dehydrogenase (short-subunit alcohol dehydrogenase family)
LDTEALLGGFRVSQRVYVVTGSASGIGKATAELLTGAGHRVIGVDRRDAEVVADLGTPEGRAGMIESVASASGGRIDASIACAGVGGVFVRTGVEEIETIIRVNYFGAIASLAGLRPLLVESDAPRAAVITSIVFPVADDDPLIAACLAGDEDDAIALCGTDRYPTWLQVYTTSKRALARWVRRAAPSAEWAGAGIALNAVAPAVIETPMTADLFSAPGQRARLKDIRPIPLRGHGAPEHVGAALAWLTSVENGFVTGQVLFADGGYDAVVRGDNLW